MKQGDYKQRIATKQSVDEYISVYADEGSYANLMFEIEREFLQSLPVGGRYLDFAVGTGRIITVLEERFEQSEGIDISDEMVRVATARVTRAVIRQEDITSVPDTGMRYDLITAFRFFLNADSGLRQRILPILAMRLRDESSMLVLNNHGRVCSIKFASFFWEKFRAAVLRRPPRQNFLSDTELASLFFAAGLGVRRIHGYSILGGKVARLLGSPITRRIERLAAGTLFARWFGVCRVYILHRVAT